MYILHIAQVKLTYIKTFT